MNIPEQIEPPVRSNDTDILVNDVSFLIMKLLLYMTSGSLLTEGWFNFPGEVAQFPRTLCSIESEYSFMIIIDKASVWIKIFRHIYLLL
jgi:hypothetical protein